LKKSGIKKGEKLYDLGAGNGRILVIAEKEFGLKSILSKFVRIDTSVCLI
jgi:ubiquinone/menaquinone biosynthesis C-methylase UbiE